jgi:pimeloyl-ACP methyl ester carboxylesterase
VRENLVLVNAFYTNSILLKGLINYLNKYFNLYFIDLPGFEKRSPPLEEISIQAYSDFVSGKIDEFDLDHYIIAGISFGFLIVNNICLDGKCKGVVAIFPYINKHSLKLKKGKKTFYNFMSSFFVNLKLSRIIWQKRMFQSAAYLYSSYPRDRVTVILEHMDGKTFFETAQIILNNEEPLSFQRLPYALIINKKDRTINYEYSLEAFKKGAKDLLIVHSEADHYPEDVEESYFMKAFPEDEIYRIITFLNNKCPN